MPILSLLLFHFFGRQSSVIREGMVDEDLSQRAYLLQEGEIAE